MNVLHRILGTLQARRTRSGHARLAAMGKPRLLACSLACTAMLMGCGQKGPLYLPNLADASAAISTAHLSTSHTQPDL